MVELQRGKIEWEEPTINFRHTFEFSDGNLLIDAPLQVIKTKIFEYFLVSMTSFQQNNVTIQIWMEFYNVMDEPDDNDPNNINIPESKGTRVV